MLTEEEARTKWCPFKRQPQAVPVHEIAVVGGCNSDADGNRFQRLNCIASECMAWRDREHPTDAFKADQEFKRSGKQSDVRRVGYCGLAGKPE